MYVLLRQLPGLFYRCEVWAQGVVEEAIKAVFLLPFSNNVTPLSTMPGVVIFLQNKRLAGLEPGTNNRFKDLVPIN